MNPFSYGTIVKGEYFYDRQEECRRIVETLSGGNNLVLFAPRRFRLSATSTTQKALIGLVEDGVVEKIEGNYFISDPFFKRFLTRYA